MNILSSSKLTVLGNVLRSLGQGLVIVLWAVVLVLATLQVVGLLKVGG